MFESLIFAYIFVFFILSFIPVYVNAWLYYMILNS